MNERRLQKYWATYQSLVSSGRVPNGRRPDFGSRGPIVMRFAAGSDPSSAERAEYVGLRIGSLLGREVSDHKQIEEILKSKDKLLFEIGIQLLESVENLDVARLEQIASSGFNVNFVHPVFHDAAIHRVASTRSRNLLRAFLKARDIDFLLRDGLGRLPSEIAQVKHTDRTIHRFFRAKERQQARTAGVDLDSIT